MLTHIVDDNGAQVMYASVTLILATVMSRGLRLMCLLKTRVLKNVGEDTLKRKKQKNMQDTRVHLLAPDSSDHLLEARLEDWFGWLQNS